MAKGYVLSAADRKQIIADHKRLTGGGTSQRPIARRRRGPRGGVAPKGLQRAVLFKRLPSASLTIDFATEKLEILCGEVVNSALVILGEPEEDTTLSPGETRRIKLKGKKNDDEQPTLIKYSAINAFTFYEVDAGTGKQVAGSNPATYENVPLIVEGHVATVSVTGATGPVFVITWIDEPVTIVRGTTVGAVTGGNWEQNVGAVLRGRMPDGMTKIPGVTNPDQWAGPAGGYALALRLSNGAYAGIDLKCQPPAT